MLKKLMILLMTLLISGTISSCAGFGMGSVDVIDMPTYDPTIVADTGIITHIKLWKENTGESPKPIILTKNGSRYIAFLPEDVKKLNQRLVLQGFMEEAIYALHDNIELYIMEINKWKKLYYNRSMQLRNLQLEINAH